MKLKVEELTFSYENRKVLDSIGFAVDEGEFVSLLVRREAENPQS